MHKKPRPPLPRLVVAQSIVVANRKRMSDCRTCDPATAKRLNLLAKYERHDGGDLALVAAVEQDFSFH
jgi:hypothetical protein